MGSSGFFTSINFALPIGLATATGLVEDLIAFEIAKTIKRARPVMRQVLPLILLIVDSSQSCIDQISRLSC